MIMCITWDKNALFKQKSSKLCYLNIGEVTEQISVFRPVEQISRCKTCFLIDTETKKLV